MEVRDLWPQVLIDQGGKSPDNLMVRLLSWMERKLYANAHTVVVLAKGAESYVRERGARRTVWLPNGLIWSYSRPSPYLLISLYSPFYMPVLNKYANALQNVIKAARLLESRNSSVRFQLIGDGPEKDDLIKLSQGLKTVSFYDPIPKRNSSSYG